MRNLAALFDIASSGMEFQTDEIATKFVSSVVASGIESGNPK